MTRTIREDIASTGAEVDPAITEIVQQFEYLSRRLRTRWRESAEALHPDLQTIGYKVVVALLTGGPTTATHLADQLGTDKSALSRQISHLERLGLVERHADEHDGRARLLGLTPGGYTRASRVRERNLAEFREALAEWPRDDLLKLNQLLRRLFAIG